MAKNSPLDYNESIKLINNLILERNNNYKFIDFVEWKGSLSKLILECPIHGVWDSTILKTIKRSKCGCPSCSGINPYTQESAETAIINEIKKRNVNYKFNGFEIWKGKNTHVKIECSVHGEWNSTSVTDFINKKINCPYCGKVGKLDKIKTIDKINCIINEYNINIKFIDFEYWKGCNTKIKFECPTHGIWTSTNITSFIKQHSGCPSCSSYGYNKKKSGYFYIQEISDNNRLFYKFGITNNNPSIRMKQQSLLSVFKHKLTTIMYFNNGEIPYIIESEIKQTVKCGVINKKYFKNGFTETVNIEDIDVILNIINKYKE